MAKYFRLFVVLTAAALVSACAGSEEAAQSCLVTGATQRVAANVARRLEDTAGLRIRRGDPPSPATRFNHVVRLFIDEAPLGGAGLVCTGTLVNSTTVVTAAHCFREATNIVEVRVTQANLLADVTAQSYRFNPCFTSDTTQIFTTPDVAVVFLNGPIVPTAYANLASSNPAVSSLANAAGYGYDAVGAPAGNGSLGNLLFGSLRVTTSGGTNLNIIAEGATQPYTDPNSNETCAGDSGGPLFSAASDTTLLGVLSGGEYYPPTADCEHSKNSIFTPMAQQASWVNSAIAAGPTGNGAIPL